MLLHLMFLEGIFFCVTLIFCLIFFAVALDLMKIFVKIQRIVCGNLYYTTANVGAMVGHTLKVVKHI